LEVTTQERKTGKNMWMVDKANRKKNVQQTSQKKLTGKLEQNGWKILKKRKKLG